MPPDIPGRWPSPALGQLVQGLSALLWTLPTALVICVQAAKTDWLWSYGIWPPVLITGAVWASVQRWTAPLLCEPETRPPAAVARAFALVLWGLSPFLHWHARFPHQPWFHLMTSLAALAGLALLIQINRLLPLVTRRMEGTDLTQETLSLTKWNRVWLAAGGLLFLLLQTAGALRRPIPLPHQWSTGLESYLFGLWMVFLVAPMALTLTLLWKIRRSAWVQLLDRTGGH